MKLLTIPRGDGARPSRVGDRQVIGDPAATVSPRPVCCRVLPKRAHGSK
jgi:hypothetical protein